MLYFDVLIFVGIITFAFIVLLLIWVAIRSKTFEHPRIKAGKRGEKAATDIIKQVLQEGDELLTNVCINYRERMAELDNVIINRSGIIIVEVKNYSGMLTGEEDDYEWTKYKRSRGGNTYVQQVRNPIKQVKRQVYLLSKVLKCNGIGVWVDGYVLLLNNNSPVHSDMVLESFWEIDQAIHRQSRKPLSRKTIIAVKEVLR